MIKEFTEALRKNRDSSNSIIRGDIPDVSLNESTILDTIGILFFLALPSAFIGAVFGSGRPRNDNTDWTVGILVWMVLATCFILYPVFSLWHKKRKTGVSPKYSTLDKLNPRHNWLKKHIVTLGLVEKNYASETRSVVIRKARSDFSLWLGKSSGTFSKLWHRAGIAENQQVSLNLEDACQNILVLGGIGSGKTTCVMQPLLLQCLDQKCGGLIFDIKGDVKDAVRKFVAANQRELIILGPKQTPINLIEGLTPEIAASFLKSAFLLSDRGHLDSFWIDTASELCRNTLGMLSFLSNRYDLQHLYQYLFDPESQAAVIAEIDRLLPTLANEPRRLLRTYCNYHELIFSQFDAKIKSGVNATVAQALAPFNHPDLIDAFCSDSGALVKMQDILNGAVYLVDMPLSIWGLGGKVAYTFIKLRFFNLMQNRASLEATDKNMPAFFMCDEFQEIVSANRDGLSDLNFWDKSRSSKTIGIISSQSIASFYATLSNHDLAHALLQNFRQKLCLRTEDPITLEFMERLVGHARVKKISKSTHHKEAGQSETISDSREGVVDAQLFRELKPNQAIAVLTLSGHSMDDVLTLMPVYAS